MTDLLQRLKVADDMDSRDAAAEIERLRAAQRTLWFILKSNNGYTLERSDMEDYPGDDRAILGQIEHADGSVTLAASVRDNEQKGDGNG